MVDEPIDLPPENVDVYVAGDLEIFYGEIADIITEQDAAMATKNVESTARGEALKETLVEGEVHTDSSESESDIEVTKIAPTSYVSGKFKLKTTPKKKKAADKEDATYEPTPIEKEKLKKKGIRMQKARTTGELPKRRKVRKVITSILEQIPDIERPESVEVEIPIQSEFRIASPPLSPVQHSISVQEVREKTPEQPPKIVEEPSSATKKHPTPQSSSHGFPKVPSNLGSGSTSLEDFGDFFHDGR